jgi:hypothetical protein
MHTVCVVDYLEVFVVLFELHLNQLGWHSIEKVIRDETLFANDEKVLSPFGVLFS